MKKRKLNLNPFKKICCCLLSLLISISMFAGLLGSFVLAEESPLPDMIDDSYMGIYFSNLTRFGNNILDSCTLIALQMMLTYYDCYWDDTLVIDALIESEVSVLSMAEGHTTYSSPGSPDALTDEQIRDVMRHASSESQRWTTYESYMEESWQQSLHSLLFKMANDDENLPRLFSSENKDCQLKHGSVVELLSRYIHQYGRYGLIERWQIISYGYFVEDTIIPSTDKTPREYENFIRNMVLSAIDSGNPAYVAVGVYDDPEDYTSRYSGHAVVAYAYEYVTNAKGEEECIIYCHGGREGEQCVDIRSVFGNTRMNNTVMDAFIQLRPIEEHEHSNHYVFADYPNGACACQLPCHEHQMSYVSTGLGGHDASCYCGYSAHQTHLYRAQGLTQKVCIYCGHTQLITPDTPVVSPLQNMNDLMPNSNNNEEEKQ